MTGKRAQTEKMRRFDMLAPPSWLKAVDEWRRRQPDIPNKSEAIRRLAIKSLRKSGHWPDDLDTQSVLTNGYLR